MTGFARIDGKAYRFMGRKNGDVPVMDQTGLEVTPTRTIYNFAAGGVRLDMTFTTPLLPDDLDVMSRPVTYLTWDARATDARSHDVKIYFDVSGEIASNQHSDKLVWSRHKLGDLQTLKIGTQNQPVLEKSGDDLRIDWGYFYLVNPQAKAGSRDELVATSDREARDGFTRAGDLPDADDLRMPRMVRDEWIVLATTIDFGSVAANPVSRFAVVAYDDLYSLEYLNRRLRPYWRRPVAGRGSMEADDLLRVAIRDYPALVERCRRFDAELTADLKRAGGEEYARLAVLAYRQTIAAHKLAADYDNTPVFFSKENFSNGSINTVDLTYPSGPFFLLFNPTLLKAQITPIMDYAMTPRWKFPFAPHDLGTYPLANGQTYGGGERTEENQMPVEESGNLLLLFTALARAEGNAAYADKYWSLLTKWAEYLRDKGLDPENQLSTDDFAGHLAHNTNLSLKAILALGGYARLAEMTNRKPQAREYRRTAEEMARKWAQMADDGTHYRLAFDKPGTWSQKYNLVWDELLDLNLFPDSIERREIAFYKTKQNAYGLPLDNRENYSKLDWIVWTATLADSEADFRALVAPVYKFTQETPDRVPLTDWYRTSNGKHVGFQARSVVGGVYIKMLADESLWRKWRTRAGKADAGAAAITAAR